MRASAHTQHQAQSRGSAGPAGPQMGAPGRDPREPAILDTNCIGGKQTAQQMPQAHTREHKARLTASASPRPGHDFSRISLHPPAAGAIQTKLAINQPGNEYEQEAESIADQVTAATAPAPERVAPLRIQPFTGRPGGQMGAAPASVGRALASSGRPLEPTLRQDMEQRFGYDFSRVRVHSGVAAAESAREVNAHAYTVGLDIVCGAGQLTAGTLEGRRLIAHEMAHVIQQSAADGMNSGPRGAGLSLSPVNAAPRRVLARMPRSRAEIQDDIDATKVALGDERRLAQVWIEGVTGRRLPAPNPATAPHPKQTRVPKGGTVGSRAGTLKRALEGIMGDESLPDHVRGEAQRRLGRLEDFERTLERLHRERGSMKPLYSGPVKKPDTGGKKPPPKTTTPPVADPGKGAPAKTPPVVRQPPAVPTTGKIASQGGLRERITKLVNLGKLNVIPLGRQLAQRLPQILAGLGTLFSLLDALELAKSATSLIAHGTALPKEQGEANQVLRQSEQAMREAEAATQDISLFAWLVIIGEAERSEDDEGLYAIDAGLEQWRQALEASVRTLEQVASDLYEKALPLEKASAEQLVRAYLPSLTTATNAQAVVLHESLRLLNNTLTAAASNYRQTSETLAWWASQLLHLEVQATDAAWDIAVKRRTLQLQIERAREFRSEAPRVETREERQAREFIDALRDPNAVGTP